MAPERALQLAERLAVAQPLDGLDGGAVDLDREHQTGAGEFAVDPYRARPAYPVLAADVDAGGAELVAEEVREQEPRLGVALGMAAVQGHRDPVPGVRAQSRHRIAASTVCRPRMRTRSRRYRALGVVIVVERKGPGQGVQPSRRGHRPKPAETPRHAGDRSSRRPPPARASARAMRRDRHDGEVAVADAELVERASLAGRAERKAHRHDHLVRLARGGEHVALEVRGGHRRGTLARTERSTTSPPSAARHSGSSELGSACAMDPHTVPRARVW